MLPAVARAPSPSPRCETTRCADLPRGSEHEPSEKAALAERAMLRALEGGCRVPVGALSVVSGSVIRLGGSSSPRTGRSCTAGRPWVR